MKKSYFEIDWQIKIKITILERKLSKPYVVFLRALYPGEIGI